MANEVLDDIIKLSSILELNDINEFKNQLKNYIQDEIYKCYTNLLEPKLKPLVTKICDEIIEVIDKKIKNLKKIKIKLIFILLY